MQTETSTAPAATGDTFPINGTDYIEFYVGNAKQAAHFYRAAFGFQLVGYRGPETGVRDRASYLLQQDKIRLVLTTPIRAGSERRGAGASPTTCTSTATACATSRSGWTTRARPSPRRSSAAPIPAQEPRVLRDDDGEVVIAAIRIYGDTIHSLVERRNYRGLFMPGFRAGDAALRSRRRSGSSTSTTASATSSWAR